MTQPTIGLDQLDALAGLLPDNTPPRALVDIARWGITLQAALQPFVEASIEAGATATAMLEEAGLSPACPKAPQVSDQPVGAGEWTDEEKQTLERMWNEGASIPAIVAALPGRTDRGVGEMRRRIGLATRAPRRAARVVSPGKPWTDAEDATLMRMWGNGASSAVIALALPGRSPKSVQVRKARLQSKSDAKAASASTASEPSASEAESDLSAAVPAVAILAEPAPEAPAIASPVAPRRAQRSGLAAGVERILVAMAELDDSFEPADDLLLVEERYKGAAMAGIAEQLGCDEAAVVKRWKDVRGCKVDNKGGLMTDKGWADLRAAVAHRAAQAEA